MSILRPVNDTQRRYNELCRLGGGQRGGPTRPKVQQLIHDSGGRLSEKAHDEITLALTSFPTTIRGTYALLLDYAGAGLHDLTWNSLGPVCGYSKTGTTMICDSPDGSILNAAPSRSNSRLEAAT